MVIAKPHTSSFIGVLCIMITLYGLESLEQNAR